MSKTLRAAAILLLAALPATVACGDDPFALNWTADPDTAVLHSLARPELNTFSAYDFNDRVPVRVDAAATSGGWDLALDTRQGQLVFIPPGALGIIDEARVLRLPNMSFEDVTEAPGDTTLYSAEEPVPVELGSVYVFRTREDRDRFGRRCLFYGKLEPTAIDEEQETVRFLFDRNPICDDRDLVADER